MHQEIELNEQQINLIHKIPLFRGVSDDFKSQLLDKLDYSVYQYAKGETVLEQNTPCRHLLILLKGKLEVKIVDVTGNSFKVEDIIAPRAFASPHLFSDNNIYPATFTTTEESILFKATKDSVFTAISTEPNLLKNFLRATGNCNACTVSRLKTLSYKSIRSRFVYYLYDRKLDNNHVRMEHNQTQLAEYLGVSRPALANEIGKLVKEGLIEVEGKEVRVLDANALVQLI